MGQVFESLSGASGLRAEGKSAQNIANFNAAIAENQAVAERQKGTFAQKRQVKRGAETKAALTTNIAAAGVAGSQVAGELEVEQAEELELENLLLGFESEVLAKRAESQAELDRLQGELAKKRGKSAARAANIQFGLQLAGLGSKTGTGQRFLEGF